MDALRRPPLQELERVERIENELWKNGAGEFTPEEYLHFQNDFKDVKEVLSDEQAKWSFVRRYDPIRKELLTLSSQGEALLRWVSLKKEVEQAEALQLLIRVEEWAGRLRQLSAGLYLTQESRKKMVQAELMLAEARNDLDRGHYRHSLERVSGASVLLEPFMEEVKTMLRRYYEKASLIRWQRWAREAIHWSREYAASAIIVRKAEKTLTLYSSGRPVRVYRIALGFNGLNNKRPSGDGATPEGKYQIALKKDEGETKYHKALLINDHNEEDIKRFKSARPRRVAFSLSRIGGLIEIHGGKESGLEQTSGCIALSDQEMDDLFGRVVVGTPVTIVGTTEGLTSPVLEGQGNEWGETQGEPEAAF